MELTLQQFIDQFGNAVGVALFVAMNVLFWWRTKINVDAAAERQQAENVRAIRNAFETERSDRQKLQVRLDELETLFEQRTAEHAAERQKLQTCVANLQRELTETKEQLEATRSRIAALTEQLDKVRTERLAEAQTLEAERGRSEKLERKLSETEARLTETKRALEEANKRISEQERRIVELETRDDVFRDLLGRLRVVAVEPNEPNEPNEPSEPKDEAA